MHFMITGHIFSRYKHNQNKKEQHILKLWTQIRQDTATDSQSNPYANFGTMVKHTLSI